MCTTCVRAKSLRQAGTSSSTQVWHAKYLRYLSLSLSLSFLLSFSIFFSLMSLWRARAYSPNLTSSFSLSRSPCFPLSFQSTLYQDLFDPHTRPDCLGHQSSTHLKQSTTLYEYLYNSNNLPVNCLLSFSLSLSTRLTKICTSSMGVLPHFLAMSHPSCDQEVPIYSHEPEIMRFTCSETLSQPKAFRHV